MAASNIVATNAVWINALALQALQRIDETLGPEIGVATPDFKNINEAVANLPGQVQAYVVDRDGETLIPETPPSSRPTLPTVRISPSLPKVRRRLFPGCS